MFIKLFIKLLLKNKNSYTKAVKLNRKIYVINIEEYKSVSNTLKNWKEKVL
ncbi:hypothetical protein [Clostridium botulinum]|uniref:hypothetical protein n=1 Tax=Clostridium botulinum TaxID=1491 RepID=UPI000AE706BD|nr:hypothetical protein [Clostridium botulinum]